MEREVKSIEEAFKRDCQEANTPAQIASLKVKYLGRKSPFVQLFSRLPSLSKEQRGLWGRRLNSLKEKITSLIEEKLRSQEKKEKFVDLTFPSSYRERGGVHILSAVNQRICSIFENLGFIILEGREIEDEWHNFTALNIPLEHPSRDMLDTFYLDIPEKKKSLGKYLLRSHTSPSQIRIMEKRKPPLAVVSPGRVYRPDEADASHSFMFHQIEGFAVGKEISFAHLKGALLYFARSFFSPDVKLRFRPHFFPFTEPSAEVDIACIICRGHKSQVTRHKPNIKNQKAETKSQKNKLQTSNFKLQKCSVCKGKGWLEILGCGMIHPEVLETCRINSKQYRGFAFGMGVERIAMLKYQIDDIRLFYENDVRFLKQF